MKKNQNVNPRNQQSNDNIMICDKVQSQSDSVKFQQISQSLNSGVDKSLSIIEKNLKLYKASLQLISRAYILTQQQCFSSCSSKSVGEGSSLHENFQSFSKHLDNDNDHHSSGKIEQNKKKQDEIDDNIKIVSISKNMSNSRLYLDGNVVFQNKKEDQAIQIMDISFEHQFKDQMLNQEDDKVDYTPISEQYFLNFMEQSIYKIVKNTLQQMNPSLKITSHISDLINISSNWKTFISRNMEEQEDAVNIIQVQQEIINIDARQLIDGNQAEHLIISDFIDENMFGMTFLKGPKNLNCLFFVHSPKQKQTQKMDSHDQKVGPDEIMQKSLSIYKNNLIKNINSKRDIQSASFQSTIRQNQYSNQLGALSEFNGKHQKTRKNKSSELKLSYNLGLKVSKEAQSFEESLKAMKYDPNNHNMNLNCILQGFEVQSLQVQGQAQGSKLLSGGQNGSQFRVNSEIYNSKVPRQNKTINISDPVEFSQFYVKRDENMFINNQMDESISIGKDYWQGRTKRQGEDIKELNAKLTTQKLFMNMVIHDLRNPAESIQQGLKQAKALAQKQQNQIIQDTSKVLLQNVLAQKQNSSIIMPKRGHSSSSNISGQSIKLDNQIQNNSRNNFVNYIKQDKNPSQSRFQNQIPSYENRSLKKDKSQRNLYDPAQRSQSQNLAELIMPQKEKPIFVDAPQSSIPQKDTSKQHSDTPSFNRINEQAVGNRFKAFNKKADKDKIKEQTIGFPKLRQMSVGNQEKITPLKDRMRDRDCSLQSSNMDFSVQSESHNLIKRPVEEMKNQIISIGSPRNRDSSREEKIQGSFSFGNIDIKKRRKASDKNVVDQQQQSEMSFGNFKIPPPKKSRQELKAQCNQILEESIENSVSPSNSNNMVQKRKSSNLLGGQQNIFEEVKEIDVDNESPKNEEKKDQEQEEDPFMIFDEGEDDDFDEMKCDNSSQINQQSSHTAYLPRSINPNDNNFVLNSQFHVIKSETGTQMEKVTYEEKEVQCEPELKKFKSQIEFLENIEYQEDEREFLKELMKNKPNLRMMMANFKEFNLKLNNIVPKRRNLTEKMTKQQNIIDNDGLQKKNSKNAFTISRQRPKEQMQSMTHTNIVVSECRQCFKISKFMIKQLEKVLKTNLQLDQYMKNAIFSSMMMTNLINDLLDSAKLEQQTFELDLDYFNMFEVITQAFQVLSFQAEMKNIQFLLHFDKNKPYVFCKILNDKRRLLQILLNFISNSLKFTSKNGWIKVHLFVTQEQNIQSQYQHQLSSGKSSNNSMKFSQLSKPIRSESMNFRKQKVNLINGTVEMLKYMQIKIVVEDNGIGIKKENIDKLFMDYNKLDEHKKMNQKGTGLGLSICRSIIKKMGGQVDVESTEGVGSKFIITFQVKAIDQIIANPQYLYMNHSQQEKYNKESGAFNFFPDFNNKFNLMISEQINEEEKSGSSEGEENQQITPVIQQLVVYKFESNKIHESSKAVDDGGKNFKILKDLRDQLLKKQKSCSGIYKGSEFDKESMMNMSRQSDISEKFNMKNQERGLLGKPNFEIKQKEQFAIGQDRATSQKNLMQIKQAQKKYEHKKQPPNRLISQKVVLQKHSGKMKGAAGGESSDNLQNILEVSNANFQFSQEEEMKVGTPEKKHVIGGLNKKKMSGKYGNKKSVIKNFKKASNQSLISMESFASSLSNHGKNIKNFEQQYLGNVIERKINCLVVNDEEFSLLIISSMLEGLSFIGKIDQASNGQDALDKVLYTERKFNCRQYDIIFLDLDMPILNGYEACSKIKDFYSLSTIREKASKTSPTTSFQSKHIEIMRLRQLIDEYTTLIDQNNASIKVQNDIILSEKLIRVIYQKVKYWCLDDLKRPYIFAYSALINEETRQKTIEAGFDGCLISPITVESITDLMTNFVDNYVAQFISEQLLTISQIAILTVIINNREVPYHQQQNIKSDKFQSTIPEEQKEYSETASPNNISCDFKNKMNNGQDKSQFANMKYDVSSSLSCSMSSVKDLQSSPRSSNKEQPQRQIAKSYKDSSSKISRNKKNEKPEYTKNSLL